MTAGVFGEATAALDSIVIAVSGDDYELDRAAAALRKLTPTVTVTEPRGMLSCPLTWAAVTQLGHTFCGNSLGQWLPGPRLRAWILGEFLRRTAATGKQPAKPGEPAATEAQPARTTLTPRPYQLEGAAVIAATGKALIFDDPGTGKTATAILGLRQRQAQGEGIFPVVIVVPGWDIADAWAREIAAWAPDWPAPVMHRGPDRNNHSHRRTAGQSPPAVLVTTYATARLDAADARGPLARLKARSVIADEAHALKNQESQQSRALRRIAASATTFAGLTGTPVTRDTGDVYPLLAAMDPPSWPDRKRMVRRYCLTEDGEYDEKVQGLDPLREPEFRAVLLGQYRRCSKADVLAQLPPKVYSARRVELPPQWRRAYDGMAADMLAELPDGAEVPVMSVLAQLTRLSQLASSACDVEIITEYDEATGEERKRCDVTLRAPSWKADALLEILAERPHQQVAVFAVSRQLITIAGAACEQAGYRCGYITGGQARGARRDDIAAFQAGELDVILATAGAGGIGITLTAAGTVVMLQRSWELDKAVQPEDRAHRIGQEHEMVEVIDVIAKDTVDDRVRALLRVKGGHLGSLVRDPRIARELLGGLR